jgi:hypothetical protein
MAGANSNIQLTDLDFNTIKNNLKTYLQSQDTLKDYNYEGSALSTLLDILAYNTQYNSYYLNQVANEMFLDTALQRGSVVSQAKLMSYVPKSTIAPSAVINIRVNNVTTPSLTLPKFTNFISQPIDGVNYNFVTTDSKTVSVSSNIANFNDVTIKQGIPANVSYTVDSIANPSFTFEIPESTVDTTTISVTVQNSSTNNSSQIYSLASDYAQLSGDSLVYFLQESITGTYQIYFGDGILGKKLNDGNIVRISYIVTQGTSSAGANNFVIMDNIGGFSNIVLSPVIPANQGGNKESIDSIKFQAPKAYAAQGRAVSKNDYITAIQQNNLGFSFDAVNVWGGEENTPVVYGQVFVCLKPTGSYNLTTSQKQQIVTDVLKPISVLTVEPTIVDPDYTYIKLGVNVYYNPSKTSLTTTQLQNNISLAIKNFGRNTLNTFNSTFNAYELLSAIQNVDASVITSEYNINLQKKIYPNLVTPTTYTLNYNTPLEKGMFSSGITSSPSLSFRNVTTIISGVYIEEVPTQTQGVDSISIINPGFKYTSTPTIKISGDGVGANAHVILNAGRIQSVVVDASGNNYTSAIATVIPAEGDTTGQNASLVVNLQGRYGTLRSYYYNTTNVKTILNSNIGTVDYTNGTITLNSFNPIGVDDPLGQFSVSVTPTTSIISSTYNGIITIDPYDNTAITVNLIAKTS